MKNKFAYFIDTLGCPKNEVESDSLRKIFESYGFFQETLDFKKSDLIVINTCGFIKSAIKQSDNTIKEYLKNKSDKTSVIAAYGCYPVRNSAMLKKKFGSKIFILQPCNIKGFCEDFIKKNTNIKKITGIDSPEIYRTNHHNKIYSYVRIAEGCSRKCGYCVIPDIKGKYRSETIDSILKESDLLLSNGIKEIILVSQDSGFFGKDIRLKNGLIELLNQLIKIDFDFRIRIMYLFPDAVEKNLIRLISGSEKICNYIDMPIQHTENSILKLMKRRVSKKNIFEKISLIRKFNPDIAIRTTIMTGYPGETDKIFLNMRDSLEKFRFDKLGIFKYSDEPETYSFILKNKIPECVKNKRYRELMKLQQKISFEQNRKYLGKTVRVLIDGYDSKSGFYLGRDEHNAPEIDGYVIFKTKNKIDINEFLNIKITDCRHYDLIGDLIK